MPRTSSKASSSGKDQHITPRDDGRWAVIGEGNMKAKYVTNSQREAIAYGKRICTNQGSQLVIHDRNGKIQNGVTKSRGKNGKKSSKRK